MLGFPRDEGAKSSSPTPQSRSGLGEAHRLEEVGDLHFQAAAYSSAVEYFRSALDALPLHPEAEAEIRVRLHRKLAQTFLDQGQVGRADQELSIASDMVTAAPPSLQAVVRLRQADMLAHRGRYAEAESLARSAFSILATTDLHTEVANAQTILGNCSVRRGRPEKAEEYYQDALATFRRIGDPIGQVYILANLATLAKNACNWARALKFFERATSLARNCGATPEMCSLHLNQAILFRKMGRQSEAMANVDKGSQLAAHLGDQDLLINYRLLQGQLHVDSSRFSDAEETLLEARVLAEGEGSLRQLALADEFLGDLMAAQGRTREAALNYQMARKRAKQISDANDVLAEVARREALLALEEGDLESALTLSNEGIETAEACGENYELGFLLRTRGRVLQRMGRVDEAIESIEQAHARFQTYRLKAESAVCLCLLAELHLSVGDRENRLRARECVRDAVDMSAGNGGPSPCSLHLMLARVELSLGNHDGALLALYEVERYACGGDAEVSAELDDLRHEIESAMTHQATEATSSYQLLADLPELLSETGNPVHQNLRSVMAALTQRLSADRGLVAVSGAAGPRVLSAIGEASGGHELLNLVMERLSEERSEGPRVWSHPQGDAHWRSALSAGRLRNIGAAVALPIWDGESLEGVLYFDRRADSQQGLGFSGDALAMASSYVHVLRQALLDAVRGHETSSSSLLEEEAFQNILTQSDVMVEVLSLCTKVASSPYTVLLTGETGTGKGLLAYALHRLSPWRDRSFVSINCAAIPESLLESELFGHVKGSFTGAVEDKEGLVVAAEGGTLLLDEIGKMSLPMQAKLLHFLDTKVVRPVGGHESREIDVRILCATKHDLKALVDRDEFLEDLYYRLLDFPIRVPPLRERPADVLLLARHYVAKTATELGRRVPGLTRAFLGHLEGYAWPGNVRELEKTMKRTVVLADSDDRLRPEHLPRELRESAQSAPCSDGTVPLKQQVAELERVALQRTLERVDWNRAEAARRLKISYPTLLQKIKLYELHP